MTWDEALEEATPIIASIAGRSGSGKTYSSLLMARGLAGPEGKIAVLDSENKRSRRYAKDPRIGGFRVKDLYPPYTSEAYIRLIREASDWADVLVIDSMSHEWAGIGGCIEQADEIEAKMRNPNSVAAWKKPKTAHKRLVNELLGAQCHVICCLRAEYKMKSVMMDGKQKWVESDDLVPEQEKRFIYEMTISATLDTETHLPKFTKIPEPIRGALASDQKISVDTGRILREWIAGGTPIDREVEQALAVLRQIAEQWGTGAVETHWKGQIDNSLRARLKPHLDDIKKIAAEADRLKEQADEFGSDPAGEEQGLDLG
jgi:hypothetical protein